MRLAAPSLHYNTASTNSFYVSLNTGFSILQSNPKAKICDICPKKLATV